MPQDLPAARRVGRKIQVLGLCRFSYPALGGFQVEHDTIEARRAMLYDPRRLDLRFVWFEHICLAGLRTQTDPDFTLIVLLGDDFPEPHRARIEALARAVPQLRLAYRPSARHVDICAEVVAAHIDPTADVIAQFRLDDDDGIASEFVQKVRSTYPHLQPLADGFGQVALDFARGLVVWGSGAGVRVEQRVAHCWAPGLVLYLPKGHTKSLLHFPHHKVWQRMPTVSDPVRIMYVRGAHDTNDSHIPQIDGQEVWEQARIEEAMARRFGISFVSFQNAMAAYYQA